MTECTRCKKHLVDATEIHVVDGEMFCSEECAVVHLTDEIIMNAKEMAKEQYLEAVEVVSPFDVIKDEMPKVNRIVEILCRRDGMTIDEATERLEEVRELAEDAIHNYDSMESLLADELGLEMDYIMDLLEVGI